MRSMEAHLTNRSVDVNPYPLPDEIDNRDLRDPPAPGTGVIWIIEIESGMWHASWQGDPGYALFDGTREEVIAWAREQPAARMMISEGGQEHIPFI
jgi:hypothetical protein